ncbi:MAG: alpha/beta hydrolase [Acidobacteriota bacterium]
MSVRQLNNLLRMVRLARGEALPSLDTVRSSMDRMGELFAPGPEVAVEPLQLKDGLTAERLRPELIEGPEVLLCVHGGGFGAGSCLSHRGLYARLARAARREAVSVGYRLAPEAPFPAARDDVLAVMDRVLNERPWLAAGDSAGANLLLCSVLERVGRDCSGPERLLLMSPWVDLTSTAASFDERDDPMVSREGVLRMANHYANGRELDDPKLSPLFAQLAGLPPTLIQVGEREALYDDSERLTAALREAGVSAQLDVWPDMVHVFQQFAGRVDEGQHAIERAGEFLHGS